MWRLVELLFLKSLMRSCAQPSGTPSRMTAETGRVSESAANILHKFAGFRRELVEDHGGVETQVRVPWGLGQQVGQMLSLIHI